MHFNKNGLEDFSRYYGIHYDICQSDVIVRDFISDAERGLAGKTSFMPMIPAYIKSSTGVPAGKKALALDAGGTNLRAAIVSFDEDGKVCTEGLTKTFMPGTRGRLGVDEFYNALAAVCEPLLAGGAAVDGIGFCFSYAMEITKDGDGIPQTFSKELDAPDAAGKPVGANLRMALAKRGIQAPERIILLNDTTATLLSGAAQIPAMRPSKIAVDGGQAAGCTAVAAGPAAGLILGTGFNIAYPEKNIPKIGVHSEDGHIVVTEAGNFLFRYQGLIDKEFDAQTKSPGAYTAEKAISGAYLGSLNLLVFKKAVEEGLLSFAKAGELCALPRLETRDLNAFLHNPLSQDGFGAYFGTGELAARAAVCYLAGLVTERAALLASALCAATVVKMGAPDNPLAPVRIAVEGTTYMMYHFMRESFEARLRTSLAACGIQNYIIMPVEQASLTGAAAAALSAA
ncbi:MAG: hexokinase [Spirochaetaceae bacterium]|jgi:hexokinase|nr:hexokinase [Spirochaetaceae bacterium]